MKHLHLLVPDLIPPRDIAAEVCAGLQLSALQKLLARARMDVLPSASLEERLCTDFAAEGVAPVRAAADGLDTSTGYWLCADPVSLQLQHAQMLVLPQAARDRGEAAAMCAGLNEHFAGSGMQFYAPQPQRWYVRLDEAWQIDTTPLSQVVWRDAKNYQPQGAEALRWQRIATELQMLLYAHPANRAREERGETAINSLWLWGGGRAAPLRKAFDAIGGDCALVESFAQAVAVEQAASLPTMLEGRGEQGLWVCAAPGDAMRRGDLRAWREAALRVEQECAQPLLRALQKGRLQRLTLEALDEERALSFTLTRADAWKLWRAARSLAQCAV